MESGVPRDFDRRLVLQILIETYKCRKTCIKRHIRTAQSAQSFRREHKSLLVFDQVLQDKSKIYPIFITYNYSIYTRNPATSRKHGE